MSDHQLIFCTHKIYRIKTGVAHKYLNFNSLKNYITGYYYIETLKQVDFPNYEDFGDVKEAYYPYKRKQKERNTQKWFDGKVMEILNLKNKLFKKFKKSGLHIDKELYKK